MAPTDPLTTDESVLLENAPRANGHAPRQRCPEGMAVPGIMRALMDFLGADFGWAATDVHGTTWRRDRAYTYFAGMSGEAFRILWAAAVPEGGFGPLDAPEDPVLPCALAFAASGYDHDIVLQAGFSAQIDCAAYASASHERLRSRLVRAVSAGKPVVAAGITGKADICILTGFGDRGDIVLGWKTSPGDTPGIQFEPDKRMRFDDWYPSTFWMVFLGEKRERATQRTSYLSALSRAARLLDASTSGAYQTGPAAFGAWAAALRDDSRFAVAGDREERSGRSAIEPWIWDLAERRWYAARFIEDALPELPDHEAILLPAMRALDEEHDLMSQVGALIHGGAEDEAGRLRNLADPAVRREVAEIVEACRAKDAEVAALLSSIHTQ